MSFLIKTISSKDTLPLRHKVLWPNHPMERSKVEGDDRALHFGGFLDAELICVASLFRDLPGIRLRKFATDPAYQGQGIGTKMLIHLLHEAEAMGSKTFWFDARESALPFYARHGFAPEGERFYKDEVPYRRITCALG